MFVDDFWCHYDDSFKTFVAKSLREGPFDDFFNANNRSQTTPIDHKRLKIASNKNRLQYSSLIDVAQFHSFTYPMPKGWSIFIKETELVFCFFSDCDFFKFLN